MNKQTKMIVGVGVVAVAAYLLYQQSQKKTTTASFSGGVGSPRMKNFASAAKCCGHIRQNSDGTYTCCNGQVAPLSNGNSCEDCGKKGGGMQPRGPRPRQSTITTADSTGTGNIFR